MPGRPGAWELAGPWAGTRTLSPEPQACQSWQQVLGRIKKASFGVRLPQPDPEPSHASVLGSLFAEGSSFFSGGTQLLQEGRG